MAELLERYRILSCQKLVMNDQGSMECADIFRCTKCRLFPVRFQYEPGVIRRELCRGLTFLHARDECNCIGSPTSVIWLKGL